MQSKDNQLTGGGRGAGAFFLSDPLLRIRGVPFFFNSNCRSYKKKSDNYSTIHLKARLMPSILPMFFNLCKNIFSAFSKHSADTIMKVKIAVFSLSKLRQLITKTFLYFCLTIAFITITKDDRVIFINRVR